MQAKIHISTPDTIDQLVRDQKNRDFFAAIENNNLNKVEWLLIENRSLANCKTLGGKKRAALCFALTSSLGKNSYPGLYNNYAMISLLVKNGANFAEIICEAESKEFLEFIGIEQCEGIKDAILKGIYERQHTAYSWEKSVEEVEKFVKDIDQIVKIKKSRTQEQFTDILKAEEGFHVFSSVKLHTRVPPRDKWTQRVASEVPTMGDKLTISNSAPNQCTI